MSDLKINGQPIEKLVFNSDNFVKLKDAYAEAMDLLVKLNAKLTVSEKVEEKPVRAKVSRKTKAK